MTNALYYGDNLRVLRDSIASESVDLIYLDPPFNSQATYNVLFRSPVGKSAEAQIEAFEDTWHWGDGSEHAYDDVLKSPNTGAAELLRAMRGFLGENDMMAYLAMMAVRLLELHRVLKSTGSLYLHCDPTASHYLKLLLDAIFGPLNFRNEISWRRSQPKSHTSVNFANCRDVILRYSKTDTVVFNKVFGEHDPDYIEKFYRFKDPDGRKYQLGDLTNPNKNRPNLTYEFLGITRVWRWTKKRMQKAYSDGLIVQSEPRTVPRIKRYLDQMEGQPISDDWDDIEHLHGSNAEFLGYPTQKPLALLERIITVSSNEGDLVLDPFCGCGTAVHAAQKLGRRWIGIDITCLAVGLIERRLKDAFPGIQFEVHGTPKTLQDAYDLADRDKYQFQWWAASAVGARPYAGKKKGADGGIDGILFFKSGAKTTESVIISVKGGGNVGVGAVRDLHSVIEREKATIGVLITAVLPTRAMGKEAAAVGLFDCGLDEKFPRLQIITLAELFQGKRPRIPHIDTAATFRTAAREDTNKTKQKKLDL